ncbi:hypothetical protein dqs_2314 [Azoarcus olearius]|uniref:retropepsin-like aspartic protease family protein n=1 Tax=Azoarcus sp. (strain BH72) TaxID=418699 RepID=UPI0008061BD5|nr:TIGR02281 family clan AA aspartic protease [Azoarcus olearius]ANQ85345.1 hypothetical protein dqs_2314 [Azoarcus olearius]
MRNLARLPAFLLLANLVLPAQATEVQLGGVIGNRAVLIVNGGGPQTISAGATTREGVKLLSVTGDEATVDVEGRRTRLRLGEQPVSIGGAGGGSGSEVRLSADTRGHFGASTLINGSRHTAIVDTGATYVSLSTDAAKRAGINYRAGAPGVTTTANGQVRVWNVRLDTVQVGDLVLHGVDAVVLDSSLPVVLLGMSFLNRTEMRREGNTLLLRKTF